AVVIAEDHADRAGAVGGGEFHHGDEHGAAADDVGVFSIGNGRSPVGVGGGDAEQFALDRKSAEPFERFDNTNLREAATRSGAGGVRG
ncbi:MAG TPA: hypothetical protein PLJ65_03325, partial [Casimicrobium sp.]|nr:hypothetical protein [Casimicrobium sp.]